MGFCMLSEKSSGFDKGDLDPSPALAGRTGTILEGRLPLPLK